MEQIKKLSEQCEQWQQADEENRGAFVLLVEKQSDSYETSGYADGDVSTLVSVLSQILASDPMLFDVLEYAIELTKKKQGKQ